MRTLYRSKFKEIGDKGDQKLLNKNVTVAGLGGVGSIVTSILAREDFALRIIELVLVDVTAGASHELFKTIDRLLAGRLRLCATRLLAFVVSGTLPVADRGDFPFRFRALQRRAEVIVALGLV